MNNATRGLMLAIGVLMSCTNYDSLPSLSYMNLDADLWDAEGVVARTDGLYVRLPYAGGLIRLDPNAKQNDTTSVATGKGKVTRLSAAPDGETLVAFVERYRCEDASGSGPTTIDDCYGDLVVETEIDVIRDADVIGEIAIDGPFNKIAYAADGRFGIAYLDFTDESLNLTGVVNLNSVIAIDLIEGSATPISVGFAADRVLFVEDADLGATKAVVLSRNSVALIDLLQDIPQTEVTFPLTLDPDASVIPVGVDLTPDGRYALISVQDSSDLYTLDLESQSINIVELSSSPAAMSVDASAESTVLVFDKRSKVDVLDHAFFDIETFNLDEAMDQIEAGDGYAVLWNDNEKHDVYRLDLNSGELVEYRLQNPAVDLEVAPGGDFAVALTRAEDGFGSGVEGVYDASPGMEILDLRDDDTQPFLLEGQGLGVVFSQSDTELHALVLQQGQDYLYQLDLYTGVAVEIDLSQPPVAIGSMADGSFYITHTSGLGLVSFLDPVTGNVTEIGGFGAIDLYQPIELLGNGGKS